jgi:predicted enzyme related to lactoylglutathione lyase
MGTAIQRTRPVRSGRGDRRVAVMRAASPARAEVAAVVLDVRNLDRETAFWSTLLDSTVLGQGDGWVDVALLGVDGPVLSLQKRSGRSWRKSRLHLDIVVDDVEQAISRAIMLGGSTVPRVPGEGSARWQVLVDPEGNEFCLLERT